MSSLSRKRLLLYCGVAVCAILFDSKSAIACSCAQKATVLDAYDQANLVIITEAISVEKSGKGSDGISSTQMVVDKAYKGSLKVGDELTFAQGGGADCIWTFSEQSVGKKFLFYLHRQETSQYVIAITCGRSNQLEYAGDDLLYLDNMAKWRGKTRLSGSLSFYQASALEDEEPTYELLEGQKVRIIGAKKTYTVITDKNGVYEIYGLPPGKYFLEPGIPRGRKLNRFMSSGSMDSGADEDREERKDNPQTRRAQVTLRAGRHAYFDFAYEADNVIRGKVFGPQGKPMDGVCLDLVPVRGKVAKYFYKSDCTEEGGRFSIDDIPAGAYLLVVNKGGKISSDEPFPTFYYPNVFERERAAVITIGEGETVEGLVVQVPSVEETITVEGVLLYFDDKPVTDDGVEFKPSKTTDQVNGAARAGTDSAGKFSIKILKNLQGELFSDMFVYSGEFENCPKVERMISESGNTSASITVKTNIVPIIAEHNIFGVELRFPFPSCKKAP